MIIAGIVRVRDRLMGIGQAITMPLFFASNALYPLDIMPAWLRVISRINPLSYQVDALRGQCQRMPGRPTRRGELRATSRSTSPWAQTMLAAMPAFGRSSGWCKRCRSLKVMNTDGTPAR